MISFGPLTAPIAARKLLTANNQYIDLTGLGGDHTYLLYLAGQMQGVGNPRLSPNASTANTAMALRRATTGTPGDVAGAWPTDRCWANRGGAFTVTAWLPARRGIARSWPIDMRGGDSLNDAQEMDFTIFIWNDTSTELTSLRIDAGAADGFLSGTEAILWQVG